jgi:oligopeptide/dipeptide ABC transporter ATP-binding protein
MAPILEVQNLHVSYTARSGEVCPALAGVSFSLAPGEILGVLGESGSGKSTLAASLLRVLPGSGKIEKGKVLFEGADLCSADPAALQKIRGGRIGLINQEPSSALHPTLRVDQQVRDVLSAHESLDRATLQKKTYELFSSVFPADAGRIARAFPHELSGGQRQRVLIAQAIACAPALVIADEPTAALDPTTQREILQLFFALRQKLALAMLFITHNPALLAGLADRILVLYAGRVAEIGPAAQILSSPCHPYTEALLRCLPSPVEDSRSTRTTSLHVIAGDPPDLSSLAPGCRFEPRCDVRMAKCLCEEPGFYASGKAHDVSCFKFAG